MPGIAGIITRKPSSADKVRAVNSMIAAMQSELFYSSGTYFAPEMGVYTGWVVHEDSFVADQPFVNEQVDVVLIFSGECYLDSQTGAELRQNGHDIGANKAAWLVHLYEQEGEKFIRKLNGLFSGLLIDKKQGKAFLFNDRYGMGRIYTHESNGELYFASDAKALLRILPELRNFDEQGVAQFLTCGCPLEERTLFRGISLLPGGSMWSFDERTCVKHKYFSLESWESLSCLSVEQFESEFQSTFRRILPRYTDFKIRLGISLTAGLDTRMIMACLPETNLNAVCYTYSGQTEDTLDAKLAARVAAVCGLEHKVLHMGSDFFADFSTWADKTIYSTAGYFGITGAHEIYLSRQARELSPLRLSGVFGGEIFRSVSTFKPINLSAGLLHPEMFLSKDAQVERLRTLNEHPVSFAAFKEIPWNLFGSITACCSQLNLRSPYLDNDLVGLAYRAPVSLRNSCDSAVRFVRNNSRALANIPTDMGYLGKVSGWPDFLRKTLAKLTFKLDYLNNEGLPHALSALDPLFRRLISQTKVFGHHKYLHYRSWFRRELSAYISEVLTDAQTRQSPFWNANFLKQMAEDHISGRKNYVQEINATLTLEAINRLLIQNSGAETSVQNPTVDLGSRLTFAR